VVSGDAAEAQLVMARSTPSLEESDPPMHRLRVRQVLHYVAAVLGIALLVVLVLRTGTATVIHQVKTIGWGFGLVLLLGGIGHLIKT
jgi:hypothetical protein